MPGDSPFARFLRSHGLALLAVVVLAAPKVRAADTEVREFSVSVDGKRAGQYTMTITRQDDGSSRMTAAAEIRLSFLAGLKTYTYAFGGTEVWAKDGRLLRLESNSNDDGKRFTVLATAEGKELRVRVNGQERTTRPDVWVTTYWRLPGADQRNQAIALLDADTGKDIVARLQYVGPAQVNVAGQMQNMAHWRLSGGAQVELWYDGAERLVREEFVEDGHRTVLELTQIRR